MYSGKPFRLPASLTPELPFPHAMWKWLRVLVKRREVCHLHKIIKGTLSPNGENPWKRSRKRGGGRASLTPGTLFLKTERSWRWFRPSAPKPRCSFPKGKTHLPNTKSQWWKFKTLILSFLISHCDKPLYGQAFHLLASHITHAMCKWLRNR